MDGWMYTIAMKVPGDCNKEHTILLQGNVMYSRRFPNKAHFHPNGNVKQNV
jgi:hypothetical protein